jgi:hypothetical protein
VSWYHNILFKGSTREAIIDYLNSKAIYSYVSPPENGFVAVYTSDPMPNWIPEMSRTLGCLAFRVFEFDDDVWAYWLYDSGELVDKYNSSPGYDKEILTPSGGDAALLCRLFDCIGCEEQVETVLRYQLNRRGTDRPKWPLELHGDLALLLGFPAFSVGLSMDDIDNSSHSGELSRAACAMTGTIPEDSECPALPTRQRDIIGLDQPDEDDG